MSLRLRLAVLFALGTALVIAVAGLGFVLQLRISLDASLDPGLRSKVAAVADEIAAPDWSVSAPAFRPLDGIVQVRALDGRLLAASPDAGTGLLLDAAQRRKALAGEVSFTGMVRGDRSRLLATTAASAGERILVVVGTGTDVSDAAVANVRNALLLAGPPAVLLAGVAAWLLAGAALRPVERMRAQAAAIGERDIDRRLAVPATRDEVAALGATFNGLLDRLQAALERERGFVADAGHELRTPLAILRAELDLAARPGRSREALAAAVHEAGQETDRLIRLAEDLLLLARMDNAGPLLRPVPTALADLLDAAARGAHARAADRGVTVAASSPAGLTVLADPDRLRQAVSNLLDNATRYSPPGSEVQVTAASSDGFTTIEVRDRGPGFPEDFLPHAFQRFQRAEAARSRDDGGTGLGLSIVQAIARAHGGAATAANRAGGGAVVSLRIPTRPPQLPVPGGPVAGAAGAAGGFLGRVLRRKQRGR